MNVCIVPCIQENYFFRYDPYDYMSVKYGTDMNYKPLTIIILLLLSTLAGCTGSDDSNDSEDEQENESENENTIEYEGDDIGECSDLADNDRDGLFDCDDPDCSGSPLCKDNSTDVDTNQTNNSQNNDSIISNETIVTLTDEMINSGILDSEGVCGILLTVNEWSASDIIVKEKFVLAIREFESLYPDGTSISFWIANLESITGESQLPALYDWRNGEVDTSVNYRKFHVIDSNQVIGLGSLDRWAESIDEASTKICLPSQRDLIEDLVEIMHPPPVNFNWEAPVITDETISNIRQSSEQNSICEVLLMYNSDSFYRYLNDEDYNNEYYISWHADVLDMKEKVSGLNISFYDTLGKTYEAELANWLFEYWEETPNASWWSWSFDSVIIDNNGVHYVDSYDDIPRNVCSNEVRPDVMNFFIDTYDYNIQSHILSPYGVYSDSVWNINSTLATMTTYEEQPGYYGSIHPGLEITCNLDEENIEHQTLPLGTDYPYVFSNQHWRLIQVNHQEGPTIIDESLLVTEEMLEHYIVCVFDAFDPIANHTFQVGERRLVTERVPLTNYHSVSENENGEFICEYELFVPDDYPEYSVLHSWIVYRDNHPWFSDFTTSNVFDGTNYDRHAESESIELQLGDQISCSLSLYRPGDIQYILDYGYIEFDSDRPFALDYIQSDYFLYNETPPVIESINIDFTMNENGGEYNCTTLASDIDGDNLEYRFSWYVNDELSHEDIFALGFNYSTFEVTGNNLTSVTCEVDVHDGYFNSNASHKMHIVTIESMEFVDDFITIDAGDSVMWFNVDSMSHTVTENKGNIDSGELSKHDFYIVIFDQIGYFDYYCAYHSNMTGTVVVE